MPMVGLRTQQNYFFDFFRDANDFIDFVKENILEEDTEITDNFIKITFYAFKRRYRNVLVYEQEYFYDDFTYYFLDRKRKYELLFKLWQTENDDNPFDMINPSNVTQDFYKGNDKNTQNRDALRDSTSEDKNNSSTNLSSSTTSNNSSVRKGNDGSIQSPLSLGDLSLGDEETDDFATSASMDKTKNEGTNTQENTTNSKGNSSLKDTSNEKLQGQRDSESMRKTTHQKLSKTEVIDSFTKNNLREGFETFVNSFNALFGKVNAGMYNWKPYWETIWDEIPMDDQRPPLIITPNIKFNNSVINLYKGWSNQIQLLNYKDYDSISLVEKGDEKILTIDYDFKNSGIITFTTTSEIKTTKVVEVKANVQVEQKTADIIININPNLEKTPEIWVVDKIEFNYGEPYFLNILNYSKLGELTLKSNNEKIIIVNSNTKGIWKITSLEKNIEGNIEITSSIPEILKANVKVKVN